MLHDSIKSAIEEAVSAEHQNPELSSKLVAWVQSLVEGNEDIQNKDDYTRRCNVCYDATLISNNSSYGD